MCVWFQAVRGQLGCMDARVGRCDAAMITLEEDAGNAFDEATCTQGAVLLRASVRFANKYQQINFVVVCQRRLRSLAAPSRRSATNFVAQTNKSVRRSMSERLQITKTTM